MMRYRTNIERLIQKNSLTRFDAFTAVVTSPTCSEGFTLAAKTHAAIPRGKKQMTEMIASAQRDGTEATTAPGVVGGCHEGIP